MEMTGEISIHSNDHTQTQQNLIPESTPTPLSEVSDLEGELAGETPPVAFPDGNDGGDISGKK